MANKKQNIERRRRRIKSRIKIGKYPRLVVYRSNSHIYAQIVDDIKNNTIVSVSSNDKDVRDELSKTNGNLEKSAFVGKIVAKRALKKKISKIVFDRNGYQYHGRVKAVAESARKTGLQF